MSAAKDNIPRSDLTIDQRRRIGAVQAAATVLYGSSYNVKVEDKVNSTGELLSVARFMYGGS